MSNLYALDDVLYHLNTLTTIGIEQGCRDCVQVATALSTPVSLPAPLEEMIALWEAVEKLNTWRDNNPLDEFYFSTGTKWDATGDSALLGKGNGALELLWRALWEPHSDDDVTVEQPTLPAAIIALAAELEPDHATD
jgi:hypothetical protein